MEKIETMINEKYWWDLDMRLALLWANMADEQGADKVETIGYLIEKVSGYRKEK